MVQLANFCTHNGNCFVCVRRKKLLFGNACNTSVLIAYLDLSHLLSLITNTKRKDLGCISFVWHTCKQHKLQQTCLVIRSLWTNSSRLSTLLVAWDVSPGGAKTSLAQATKSHLGEIVTTLPTAWVIQSLLLIFIQLLCRFCFCDSVRSPNTHYSPAWIECFFFFCRSVKKRHLVQPIVYFFHINNVLTTCARWCRSPTRALIWLRRHALLQYNKLVLTINS